MVVQQLLRVMVVVEGPSLRLLNPGPVPPQAQRLQRRREQVVMGGLLLPQRQGAPAAAEGAAKGGRRHAGEEGRRGPRCRGGRVGRQR